MNTRSDPLTARIAKQEQGARIAHRKGLQKDGVHQREDSGICANA